MSESQRYEPDDPDPEASVEDIDPEASADETDPEEAVEEPEDEALEESFPGSDPPATWAGPDDTE